VVHGEGGLKEGLGEFYSIQDSNKNDKIIEKNVCTWCVILRLKDLSPLCCIYIILECIEGKIVDIVQIECYFELIFLHVF
jgi:hypothetical protein